MRSPLSLTDDPIAGLATPPGTSALAMIRMSGSGLKERLIPMMRRPNGRLATMADFVPRLLQRVDLVDPIDHGRLPLDQAMMVFFPGPNSYTGEDMAEIHCHGSPVVVRHILDHLTELGIRPAKPGEFTRRACLNGKMDLIQAEAMATLINSATLRSAQEAMRQMEGTLSVHLKQLRERVLKILAQLEATLDFVDESSEALPSSILMMEISYVTERLGELLRSSVLGRQLHDGMHLMIAGRPNVGKSSLFNALLGKQRAIVSPLPGTTRDCIESRLELQGIAITLIDTAGLRETHESIEQEGIKLTRERLTQADGVLLVLDAQQGVSDEDMALLHACGSAKVLVVWNKMDLVTDSLAKRSHFGPLPQVHLSCLTGEGMDGLIGAMTNFLLPISADGEGTVIMAARQREGLTLAIRSLAECESLIAHNSPREIAALPLRNALEALGELVGQITHEALLDQIFGTFCIGK